MASIEPNDYFSRLVVSIKWEHLYNFLSKLTNLKTNSCYGYYCPFLLSYNCNHHHSWNVLCFWCNNYISQVLTYTIKWKNKMKRQGQLLGGTEWWCVATSSKVIYFPPEAHETKEVSKINKIHRILLHGYRSSKGLLSSLKRLFDMWVSCKWYREPQHHIFH